MKKETWKWIVFLICFNVMFLAVFFALIDASRCFNYASEPHFCIKVHDDSNYTEYLGFGYKVIYYKNEYRSRMGTWFMQYDEKQNSSLQSTVNLISNQEVVL